MLGINAVVCVCFITRDKMSSVLSLPSVCMLPLKKKQTIRFNAITARGQTFIKVQACTVKKRGISSFFLSFFFLKGRSGWAVTSELWGY